jgi:hypothetical protein
LLNEPMKCTPMIPQIVHFVVYEDDYSDDGDDSDSSSSSSSNSNVAKWQNVVSQFRNGKKDDDDNDNGWKVKVWDIQSIQNEFPDLIKTLQQQQEQQQEEEEGKQQEQQQHDDADDDDNFDVDQLIRYHVLQKYGGIMLDNSIVPMSVVGGERMTSFEPLRTFGPVFVVCEEEEEEEVVVADQDGKTNYNNHDIKSINTISNVRMDRTTTATTSCRRISNKVIGSIPNHPIIDDAIHDIIVHMNNTIANKNKNNKKNKNKKNNINNINDTTRGGGSSSSSSSSPSPSLSIQDWWTTKLLLHGNIDDGVDGNIDDVKNSNSNTADWWWQTKKKKKKKKKKESRSNNVNNKTTTKKQTERYDDDMKDQVTILRSFTFFSQLNEFVFGL